MGRTQVCIACKSAAATLQRERFRGTISRLMPHTEEGWRRPRIGPWRQLVTQEGII